MALFQKNPHSSHEYHSLFTLGAHKTILLVGLGNPGKEYEGTRHNIGFVCLDAFAKAHEFDTWTDKKDLKCQLTSKTLGETRVILCKPTTFMNLSGEAVQKAVHFYKIEPDKIGAVHDELDIPFGQIRMRQGGSDAGHNGIKSLIQHIGADFSRIRIGIGGSKPEQMEGADFVLAKFRTDEVTQLTHLTKEATSILTEYIYRGELTPETRSFII
jgi:peptidyl-tRNA hydrolase, PTH1 family